MIKTCSICGKEMDYSKKEFDCYCTDPTLERPKEEKLEVVQTTIEETKVKFKPKEKDDSIKCPRCKSKQIIGDKKGFSLGKSVAGGVLLGPAGLLGGFIGSGKVQVSCLKCGFKWTPQYTGRG